jgi:type II secretory ATPase GspE/PulE/Tfp pilus assembly ATPase PilB-like protein
MNRDTLMVQFFFNMPPHTFDVYETIICTLMESIDITNPKFQKLINIENLYGMISSSNEIIQKMAYQILHSLISVQVQTDSLNIEMHPIEDIFEIKYKINQTLMNCVSVQLTMNQDIHDQFAFLASWMLLFDHFVGAVYKYLNIL